MQYDVLPFLKTPIPGLINLLGTQNISWGKINKNFDKNLQKARKELIIAQKPIFRDVTFYSIIMYKYFNTGEADGMFDWYRTLFESLSLYLTPVEKKLIHASIYGLLIEPDKNYLNFIGELATLNEFKKHGEYDLVNAEEPIQKENNTTADFLFLRKIDNTKILVEVVNLHMQGIDIENNEHTRRFIESKLQSKIRLKFLKPDHEYYLQPVIWAKDINNIEQLFNLYSATGLLVNNVLAPFTYFTYRLTSGQYEHHFDRVY